MYTLFWLLIFANVSNVGEWFDVFSAMIGFRLRIMLIYMLDFEDGVLIPDVQV